MRYLYSIFCFLCIALGLEAKTLHTIIVADTIHDITLITQPDLKSIQEEMKIIAQHTDQTLKEKIFAGSEFSKQKLINYIKNLKVKSDDSVVFYFSGHGYRTKEKKTSWPFLSFELYKVGLDLKWIADTLWDKKPRFALVMSDCCNEFSEKNVVRKTKNILINLHKTTPKYVGYKQLFCNAKGCVVVTSCSEGEFSYGSVFGGVFTRCFLISLNKEIAEPKPSWKNLLKRVCSYVNGIQKPICQIYH